MIKAFRERRPWAAALFNFLLHPFLGMLYLGRGRLALFYLVLEFAWAAVVGVFVIPRLWSIGPNLTEFLFWDLPLGLIGAVHGWRIARQRSPEAPLPVYSRYYALLPIWLMFPISAFVIRTYFYQPFNAPSTSMSPAMSMGDYFFASKRSFEPRRGDIVVYRGPNGDYVKRIVGLPGDRVQMIAGKLILNGKAVPRRRIEDYVDRDPNGFGRPIAQYEETLPSGGSVRTLDMIEGSGEDDTQLFVVPAGHYFVLGDNRDNSDDSGITQGYIPRANIVGKVAMRFADRKHKTMIWETVN